MAAPEIFQLAQVPLTCHSFNADRSQVAVSLNSNEAHIFSRSGGEWKPGETLSEHDKMITSIDWAPNTNRIVTCSQDRNAYVWEQKQDPQTGVIVWKPTLVLLRINRAATYVRWSPKEDKFAVASGARGSGWEPAGSLDDITTAKTPAGSRGASAVGRLNNEAFNRFKNADSRGATGLPPIPGSSASTSGAGGELLTVHQNTITSVRAYEGEPGNITRVSTSGKDGHLVIWDVAVKTGAGGAAVVGLTSRLGGVHLR
ncbi:hypothetical protein RSAG8_06530, partial [Rhizoctonia solani AG-8 WAC10335]